MLTIEEPGADPIRFRWDYLRDDFWTGDGRHRPADHQAS